MITAVARTSISSIRSISCALLIGCGSGSGVGPALDADPSAPDAEIAAGADASPGAPDAGIPVVYDCAPAAQAGHQEIDCPDGVHVDVEASAACVAGGCGLILDIHGLTSTGDEENAHTRLRDLAPPAGYIVLQPTSPGQLHEWSSGDWDDSVWDFVRAARDVFDVDPDRVHVTGFSQGGMMTLRLLCAHSDEIASVAPSAGGGCFVGGGAPEVPRPVLYTHGTTDAIVSFSVGTQERDGAISAYGLSGAGEVFDSGPGYEARRWTSASGEVLLEFWQHDWEAPPAFGIYPIDGHCLPGPVEELPYRCRDDGQYDQSVEILRFFAEHPR